MCILLSCCSHDCRIVCFFLMHVVFVMCFDCSVEVVIVYVACVFVFVCCCVVGVCRVQCP